MSRTAVVAFFLTLFILGKAAFAAPCDDRILGFNTYEDYDDKMQPDPGVTVFEIEEYSPDTAFEGVLVKGDASASLEIGFQRKKGHPVSRTETFSLEKSEHKKGYSQAAKFDGKRVFAGDENYFVMKIVKNGRPVCEDEPKEVFHGH
jgi:hypothetical protein